MGASNVAVVYTYWAAPLRRHDRPFRLLAYMALSSLDADNPPVYFGGRDALANALGLDVPSGDSAPDRRARHAAYETVRAAVAVLVEAGALDRVSNGKNGQRAVYGIRTRPVDNRGPSSTAAHLNAGSPCTCNAGSPCTSTQAQPAPGTGSPCVEGQAHPAPKENLGVRGTEDEEEHLGGNLTRLHLVAVDGVRQVVG